MAPVKKGKLPASLTKMHSATSSPLPFRFHVHLTPTGRNATCPSSPIVFCRVIPGVSPVPGKPGRGLCICVHLG